MCECCALATEDHKCKSCMHSVAFHRCLRDPEFKVRWRKGSLRGGDLDVQRAIYNLHRKRLPTHVLEDKATEYVAANLLTAEKARNVMRVIEQERECIRTVNEVGSDEEQPEQRENVSRRLSMAEMAKELERREGLMQAGQSAVTDQWRVYTHIINSIRTGTPLRLMVQASAGTGADTRV